MNLIIKGMECMNSHDSHRGILGRLAEMKRIYTVIESSISHLGCVVVSSGIQREGKSTLAVGIAMAAAQRNDTSVLLVDFHWYAPALHQFFGLECGDRVEDYTQDGDLDTIVRKTSIENLYLLPALKDQGLSRRNNDDMSRTSLALLKKAKSHYGVIIVDTAPAFPTNYRMIDPVEVTKASDGVVLVTLTNVTPRQHLKRTCTTIETSGGNILGIVANQWLNPMAS